MSCLSESSVQACSVSLRSVGLFEISTTAGESATKTRPAIPQPRTLCTARTVSRLLWTRFLSHWMLIECAHFASDHSSAAVRAARESATLSSLEFAHSCCTE